MTQTLSKMSSISYMEGVLCYKTSCYAKGGMQAQGVTNKFHEANLPLKEQPKVYCFNVGWRLDMVLGSNPAPKELET